jgi:membrane fusion protein (multidrug efflux system)
MSEMRGNSRRNLLLALLALSFLLAGAAALAWHLLVGRYHETTDNAYVGGSLVQLTPQAAGTVTAIYADETQRVTQGQLLVELDAADADVALARAQADLADAVRGVRGLFVGRGQAQVLIEQRRAELTRVQAEVSRAAVDVERTAEDLRRRQALRSDEAVSAEEVEHARQAAAGARAALQATLAARDAVRAQIAQAREQLTAALVPIEDLEIDDHPRVLQAAARLKEAYLARARTRIVAPIDGHVVKRSVQVGQRLAPGAPLMAIVPLERVWVDANFKENQLSKLRLGQPVKLTADAWDGVGYEGRIVGLGAGTGGALSVLPAQNATGNWIKIVQRVPVRIGLDAAQLREHPLRIGLSMRVDVDVRDTDGARINAVAGDQPVQATPVFDEQAAQAEQMIARIIAANRGGKAAVPAAP